MHYFKTDELSIKDKKKKLVGAVIPRPVALILTESDEEIINIAPFSYFNIVTYNPPIISVSIQRANGEVKDTARNILSSKQAAVHIVDENILENANQTSASLPPEQSELTLTDFTLVPSVDIEVPGIKEAAIRYETKLYNHIVITNEEAEKTADLLLLEIVSYHIAERVYDAEREYILAEKLAPVSRLAGNDYSKLGPQFTLERPN